MLIGIALALGAAAMIVAYAAVAYVSLALGFAALAFLLAAGAVLMLDRSRREPAPKAAVTPPVPPPRAEVPRAQPEPFPGIASDSADAPASEARAIPADDSPAAHAPRFPDVVMPEDINVASVAGALLASATTAGAAVRAVIWRADGAGEAAAVPVTVAGRDDETLLVARQSVTAAIAKGTAVLESLTIGPEDSEESTVWHYVVPISLGPIGGAAALDFVGARPDLDVVNRIAAAFRLPLAAALALEVATEESDAAHTLLQTARELARLFDPDAVVRTALESALQLTGATTGSIMLYDESGANLRIATAVGLPAEVVDSTAVRPGNGIAGWVAISGQPLVVEDLPGRDTPSRSRGIRSAASVPVADYDGVLGVLNVGSPNHPSRFTTSDLETLGVLAHQTAVAVRNARAVASASNLYFDTLKALALAIETKDPYAQGDTERVMLYTALLAKKMDLSADETRALEVAAILHDIGMPSAGGEPALASNRPLSTVERGLITMHPVIAAEILEQAPALRKVAPIVYHHHERYDGSGYVGGLAGGAIPLGSRILAVADAFVAMTSERSYRGALSDPEALEELQRESGTQFDPEIVDAFLAINASQSDKIPGHTS
ncbi:MAG: GAF domain-containing protein [Coriobacteriia bacterium]|nr:GAF domain-containing protein [Coriobacteriia bacterium]